jgi:ABC-type lipoprotein export system ATPase subunit/ABC-type antimicrobial peptide transport system permease subunit
MIKLENVHKYYNKGKRNQNHVCNNINLELGDSGLVVIVGRSGSGKTTLLNILSGMDKFDQGTITFDGETFAQYKTKRWDTLRRNKIGYIYQNYHLLMDLSVSENIELILKMYGMSNPDAIKNRIQVLLDAVGLSEYGDRLAKQLSGGQQQRIAFARALAKDPTVILADEPTGNVDSKTTIELMNILKKISMSKLVVMVTHEYHLAEYYADRIIELQNGLVINDLENDKKQDLTLLQEQIIYLNDYDQIQANSTQLDVTRYFRKDEGEMDVSLIERNDTLYIKVDAQKNKHIRIINQDSEVEIKHASSKDAQQPQPIEIDPIEQFHKNEGQSAVTFQDSFKYAKRKFKTLTYGGKLLFAVLFLVGVIASLSVGMIGETFRVDQNIAEQNRHYIGITTGNLTYEEMMAFEDIEGIEQVLLINREVQFFIESEKFYEVNSSLSISALPVDLKFLNEELIIAGTMPDGYGIVIDKSIADEMINTYHVRGVDDYDDVLRCSFKLQASGIDSDLPHDTALYFPISGIAEDFSRSVWMAEDLMYSLVTPNLVSNSILKDAFEMTSGTMPTIPGEVVLHEDSSFLDKDEIPYSIGITTGQYTISGTFTYTKDDLEYNLSNLIVTSFDFLKQRYFGHKYHNKINYEFFMYSTDVEGNLDTLRDMGYLADNAYLYEAEDNQVIKFDENINIYVLSIAGIIASAISIYFIMRTSLITRVYEVSVYRSLGASKGNIRKMFFVEIMLTSTVSVIVGYLLMTFLLIQAEASVAGGVHLVHYNITNFFLGIVGLYGINILFGLIPINILLRHTPAEIMKQYDL